MTLTFEWTRGPGSRRWNRENRTSANITSKHNALRVVWKNLSYKSSIVVFRDGTYSRSFLNFLLWERSLQGIGDWNVETKPYKKKGGIRVLFFSSWLYHLQILLIEVAFLLFLQKIVEVCHFIILLCHLSHCSFSPPFQNGLVRKHWDTALFIIAHSRISEALRKS